MLEQLAPEDWEKPTDCVDWDVRAVAGHSLGMAEMAASMRELCTRCVPLSAEVA